MPKEHLTPRGILRRKQIVDAAVAVITEKGLQNLSLSEIEQKADMSRGQLTYYFGTKEAILLAVFDRLLSLAYERIGTPTGGAPEEAGGWDWVQHLLERMLAQPPVSKEFSCLQYTFLSQIGHRDDFRQRLATLYEEWRSHMGQGLAGDLARKDETPRVEPRVVASLVQALLHGLGMQLAADPQAFPREEMLRLCLDVLANYLHLPVARRRLPAGSRTVHANGTSPSKRTRKPNRFRERES